jgi:hypothetical protein
MLGCIHPMSSPMMNRMLGFFADACATADAAEITANNPTDAYDDFRSLILTWPMDVAGARRGHRKTVRRR